MNLSGGEMLYRIMNKMRIIDFCEIQALKKRLHSENSATCFITNLYRLENPKSQYIACKRIFTKQSLAKKGAS